jgi:hypothetical protein
VVAVHRGRDSGRGANDRSLSSAEQSADTRKRERQRDALREKGVTVEANAEMTTSTLRRPLAIVLSD